jgi:putative salt-induced outer membrane protein YdiY
MAFFRFVLLIAAVFGVSAPARAADPAFDPLDDAAQFDTKIDGVKPWRGDLAVGLQANSGNTHSGSLTSRGALDYLSGRSDNRLDMSYVDTWARATDTDHQFAAGDQYKFDIGKHTYTFALARYTQDDDASVTKRLSMAGGLGEHLLSGKRRQLDIDIGVGWSHSQDHDADDFEDQAIGVLGVLYRQTIGENSEVRQTLQTEGSSHNVFFASITSLRLKLIGNWFVSLDYELRHNTRAAEGTLRTDEIRSANIGWKFGEAPKAAPVDPLLAQPPGDAPYVKR